MLKVNEVLQLSLCRNFKLICGEEDLNNTFSGAVILELESIKNGFSAFNYGDYVLASYFIAKSAPDIINNALSTIIKRKVSGIAIKICDDQTIPDEIISLAIENHVPICTFVDEYMEDLIITISENLKTKAQYIIYEEKLNSILNGKMDKHSVKTTALEINSDFLNYVLTAYITPINNEDNAAIHSYFKRLMYSQYRNTQKCSYSFIKYNYGIVIICTFNEDDFPAAGTHYNYIASLLKSVSFNPHNFFIGICDTAMTLHNLNISVKNAIDANEVCRYLKCEYKTYSNMGIYKYIMALVSNDALYKTIEDHINTLKKYDNTYSSNILDTLIVYIKHNGDVTKTSSEIFQHTNTVRYRIKKAKSILSLSSENAYEELYIIINCYLLKA